MQFRGGQRSHWLASPAQWGVSSIFNVVHRIGLGRRVQRIIQIPGGASAGRKTPFGNGPGGRKHRLVSVTPGRPPSAPGRKTPFGNGGTHVGNSLSPVSHQRRVVAACTCRRAPPPSAQRAPYLNYSRHVNGADQEPAQQK